MLLIEFPVVSDQLKAGWSHGPTLRLLFTEYVKYVAAVAAHPGAGDRPDVCVIQYRAEVVIVIRSVIFNILFYLVLFVYLIAAMPTLLMPRGALLAMVKNWSRVNLWLLQGHLRTSIANFAGWRKSRRAPR